MKYPKGHHNTCMASYKTVMALRIFASGTAFLLALLLFGCSVSRVSASEQDSRALTIVAAGDTNGYHIIPEDGELLGIGESVSEKDIFIFNAEGVFSERLQGKDCHRFKKQSLFLSSPEFIDSLPRGKITVASLANNHALDCDREGLFETMQEFRRRGILPVGAGENIEEACKPLMLEVKGFTLAILAYLEIDPGVLTYAGMEPDWFSADHGKGGIASWKLCNGQKQISEIRKKADIILVFVHLHQTSLSWTDMPPAASILFVNNLLDAGADIVLGSGPHFPQGIMRNNKGIALLSLGNFLYRQDDLMPEKAYRSILADFTISNDLARLATVPLRLDSRGIPRIAAKEDAGIILNRTVFLSYLLDTPLEIRGERGYIEMQRMQINRFPETDSHKNTQ